MKPIQPFSRTASAQLIKFGARPTGYALFLAVAVAIFLLVMGLNSRSLPFIPDSVYSDTVTSHWPDALFFQRSIQSGYFPLWRPLIMSGQPFATNPLNKVWYPAQWAAIVLPPTIYLNLTLWLHLVIAGVGMRAFARRLDFSVAIASVMGMAYAFTPRLIVLGGAGHLDVIAALAWLPWLLWAVEGVRWRWIGVFAALCFLGDVRTAVFVFALAGIYALRHWNQQKRQRVTLLRYGYGAALAVGLTAVQWLPLIFTLPLLSRAGLIPDEAGIFSLQPINWTGLIVSTQAASQETLLYVGIGVLTLAFIGLVSDWRKRWFWGAAVLLAGLYAMGLNGVLWPLVVRLVPALLWLRVPPRVWSIGILALIVLAGYGLQILLDPVGRKANRRLISRLSAVLFGAAVSVAFIAQPLKLVFPAIVLFQLIVVGITLLSTGRKKVGVAVWGAIIALDLLAIDSVLIQGQDQRQWLDSYAPIAQALIADNAARVYTPSDSLPQAVAAYWNIQTFGGTDPFQLAAYIPIVERASGVPLKGYSVTLPALDGDPATVNQNAQPDARLLATWQVSHVVSAFPIDNADLRLLTRIGDTYLYRNIQYQPGRLIEWHGPNQVTLRADDSTVGVLPDLHGWQRAVTPDGLATYTYAPPEVFAGAGISLLILLVSVATVMLLVRPK